MGEACSKQNKRYITPEEVEVIIQFRSYNSSFDRYYKKIESDFNYLKYVQIYEYLLLLSSYHKDKVADGHHKGYDELIDRNNFCVYVDNKILRNHLIYDLIAEDEKSSNITRDYLQQMFDTLLKSYIDLEKHKNPGKRIKKGEISCLKKLHLIPLGLLNCSSNNNIKINFLFNLFANDNNRFAKNENLNDFLYFLFLTASTASLRIIKSLGEKYSEIEPIENEAYIKIMDAFEIKDIIRARDLFIQDFFKEKEELHIGEFTYKFEKEDFGWIFSAKGIREFLEKHNDVPANI